MGEHRQKCEHDQSVNDIGPLLEPVVVNERDHDHGDQAHGEPDELALQVVLRIPAGVELGDARGRVHHHSADQREHEGTADQDEVAVPHRLPKRVPLPAMAPPSRLAREMNGHGVRG